MWGIYKITFENQKSYIGQSCDLKRRFREYKNWKKCCKSQVALYAAFEKYGYEKATFTTIYESSETLDQKVLDELEIKYIKEYNTLTPNGYNIEKGGHGHSNYSKFNSSMFSETYSPYVNEPVLDRETNEEYATVPEWIKKNHLGYDAIYMLYEKGCKFQFKNQNKLKWDLGDGTCPYNATIEDVRHGKASAYVKIPHFNSTDEIIEPEDSIDIRLSELERQIMLLKEKSEQIINKQSELIDLLLEKNKLLIEMNTELKNRIQILNKKINP